DVFLFAGSIASNLTLGRDDVSRDAAIAAAQTVHADPFIRRLPGGYDERVRERGNNLSVGQRQLLAFARALAYRPAVLVLAATTPGLVTAAGGPPLPRGRRAVGPAPRFSPMAPPPPSRASPPGKFREGAPPPPLLQPRALYSPLYQPQYAHGAAGSPPLQPAA